MKYYKRIGSNNNWFGTNYVKKQIYKESEIPKGTNYVKKNWKEVPEFEYIFQEGCRLAKEITEKIERKSKEPIPQFASGGITHKTNNKMTHEEAIRTLNNESYSSLNQYKAINYAIEQLHQCEVYDKPVEMHTTDFPDQGWSKRMIVGKFMGKFVEEDLLFEYAELVNKPKQPLGYKEWIEKNYPYTELFTLSEICEIGKKYQKYLNQFKPF